VSRLPAGRFKSKLPVALAESILELEQLARQTLKQNLKISLNSLFRRPTPPIPIRMSRPVYGFRVAQHSANPP
jgi:hypothetical protein